MPGRRARWTLGLAAAAVAALAVTVRARVRAPVASSAAPTAASTSGPPLEVKFFGCAAVAKGPVCELKGETRVTLWVGGASAGSTLFISADDHALTAEETLWPDGRSERVTVPAAAHELRLRRVGDKGEATWILRLAATRPTPATVTAAQDLRQAGRFDEAAALLADHPGSDPSDRDARLALLARIDYQRGRIEEAVAGYRASIERRVAAGRLSEASADCFALTFLLLEHNRIAETQAVLSRVATLSPDLAGVPPEIARNEARIALRTGDLRSAMTLMRQAAGRFERIGAAALVRSTRLELANGLVYVGRNHEAIAQYRALLDALPQDDCEDRAIILDNVGWAGLRILESGSGADPGFDIRAPLHDSAELRRSSCPNPNRLASALTDLAEADLALGHPAEARVALGEANRTQRQSDVLDAMQRVHLAGQIALASQSPSDALTHFRREADLAAALGASEERSRAALDTASALVALHREREALAALEEANQQLDARASTIPWGEGKETFLVGHTQAAEMEVLLLTHLGRIEDAVAVARSLGSRALAGLRLTAAVRSLDAPERARWQDAIGRYRSLRETIETSAAHDWALSADRLAAATASRKDAQAQARAALDTALALLPMPHEATQPPLAPLPSGVLEIVYFPTPSGWLAFARDATSAFVSRELGAVDAHASADEVSRRILSPFDEAIARATRLRLHPYGALRGLDIQALPWRGSPLLDHASVEYALDLDRVDSPDATEPRSALVVADPTGDLPAARAEADAVEAALATGGWRVDRLRGDGASGDAVRAALGRASLLHYAGHASFGGIDGVESLLALAAGAELTPTDILALPHVPAFVALFGCDTGREATSGALDSLGLASAFLAAGSGSVLATTRVVDDTLAKNVATAFYRQLTAHPGIATADALREALTAVRADAPTSDWQAFRAFSR